MTNRYLKRLLSVSTFLIQCFIAFGQCTFSNLAVQETCTIDDDLNLVTTLQLTPTFSEACTLSEYCFSKIGDDLTECVDVSALEVGTDTPLLVELPGPGIYLVWAATTSSTSEFIEIAVNCYDDTFDCPNP